MKKSIIISLFAVLTTMGFTSCLDTESDRFVDWDRELTSQDSVYHILGILNNVKQIGARYILLGEVRGDLVTTTEYAPSDVKELNSMNISNTNSYTTQREYYRIINQCNYLIEKGQAIPRERAAAITIRAWTYLQLVLNYGKARYYENFINSDEGANAQYPEYDIDELTNKVIPQLEAIKDMELPWYDKVGGVDLSTQMMDVKFVLGDYYLWAGKNNPSYYEKAAALYYALIYNRGKGDIMTNDDANSSHLATIPATAESESYTVTRDAQLCKWASNTFSYNNYLLYTRGRDAGREPYTYISIQNPDSSAVRSNIDTLCGYPSYSVEGVAIKPSSVASTIFSTTEYAYVNLDSESDYMNDPFVRLVQPLKPDYTTGDLRALISMRTGSELRNNSNYRGSSVPTSDSLIAKYNTGTRKDASLYRVATMYLRYAEAVNRAGKPNLAMIALKYGLNYKNVMYYMPLNEKPEPVKPSVGGVVYDEFGLYRMEAWNKRLNQTAGSSYRYWNNQEVYDNRGVLPLSATPGGGLYYNENSDTIYYCFNDSVQSYYDFYDNAGYFNYNFGLHSRGAGCAAADESYKMPYELYPMPHIEQTDPNVLIQQQEYMEDLIAKEYAIETAFEGGRFYDLMRISRHQGSPKFLADRVSRKPGAKSAVDLSAPSERGWDSDSWYLPLNVNEK